ncbi:hypothetical protein KSP40_PGU014371 [Platanthera guangdongensis]|uniref:Uncharacterized protein n=1 Tax=Platanthera guangdongensis TaxID=2320717 RepID=A0ABR2MHD1_9ASPA
MGWLRVAGDSEFRRGEREQQELQDPRIWHWEKPTIVHGSDGGGYGGSGFRRNQSTWNQKTTAGSVADLASGENNNRSGNLPEEAAGNNNRSGKTAAEKPATGTAKIVDRSEEVAVRRKRKR